MCGQWLFRASNGSRVESVGNDEVVCCLAPACASLPRAQSDQLVMKDERLIGVEFPGGMVNPAVGQGSQN